MRLATKNILFVKCHTYNGKPYSWFVYLKDHTFIHYDNYVDGKTALIEFPVENLPVSVQKFLTGHNARKWEEMDGVFETLIYGK